MTSSSKSGIEIKKELYLNEPMNKFSAEDSLSKGSLPLGLTAKYGP
jgi:hypothetical protein